MFDGTRVPVEQLAATATVGHFGSPRFGWSVTAGGVLGGRIDNRGISGGGTLAGTVSLLALCERAWRPFVGLTATLGTAFVRATGDDRRQHSWWAFDLRGGVTVGKTFAERWVPYVSARAFEGPVMWHRGGEDVRGGDRYHVTAGAGLIVRLPASIDITAEGMPLGERSVALGVTKHL